MKTKEPKQHNVGERFENDKLIYEVRESKDHTCRNCSFFIEDEGHCVADGAIETCSGWEREDLTDVIFVQVGEAE